MSSARVPAVRVVFANQGGGHLFRDLVAGAAAGFGRVAYVSPDEEAGSIPGVRWVRAAANTHRSGPGRVWDWTRFSLAVLREALRAPAGTPLVVTTNPPVAPFLARMVQLLRGQPIILLYWDLYPEALELARGLRPDSLLSRAFRWLNRGPVRHANAVVTISRHMAATLQQYGRGGEISIVPTWVDSDWIVPREKETNAFAREHGQIGCLTVMYAGNIGEVHDLRMLPDIADRLRDDARIRFLVVGDGGGRAALERELAARGLENVKLIGYQPEKRLPEMLGTADIALVSLREGAEAISMPSKTYYCMAAGSALLTFSNPSSDLARVVAESGGGTNVPQGAVEEAVAAIRRYAEDPALLAEHRRQARNYAQSSVEKTRCVSALIRLVEQAMPDVTPAGAALADRPL